MGHCPSCGTTLNSPREVSRVLGVSASRVRGVLSRHPHRLQGGRVGRHWLVPAQAVKNFQRQAWGVRLPADHDAGAAGVGASACPKCGAAFLSVKQAAQALGRSIFYIYAILDQDPGRLQAFRVGRRWVIPQRGVNRYKETQLLRGILDKDGNIPQETQAALEKILQAPPDGTQEIEVVVKPEKCDCGAYPFPHRKGGGQCQFASGDKGLSKAQKQFFRRIKDTAVDRDELNHLEKRSLNALLRKGRVEIDEATGRLKAADNETRA